MRGTQKQEKATRLITRMFLSTWKVHFITQEHLKNPRDVLVPLEKFVDLATRTKGKSEDVFGYITAMAENSAHMRDECF